jgi:hypothetical protein
VGCHIRSEISWLSDPLEKNYATWRYSLVIKINVLINMHNCNYVLNFCVAVHEIQRVRNMHS